MKKKQESAILSKKSAEKHTRPLKKMDIPKSKIKRSRADGFKDVEFEISRKAKDYLIYGRNAVLSVLINKSRKVKKILTTEEKMRDLPPQILQEWGDKIKVVEPRKIDILARTRKNQSILAYTGPLIEKMSINDLLRQNNDGCTIFLLDQLQDPRNIGSIIRSCYCFGVDAVVMTTVNAPDVNCAVVRGSAGYSEILNIHFVPNLSNLIKKLKSLDFFIVGLDMSGDQSVVQGVKSARGKKLCVVLGSEGSGMRDLIRKKCDSIVSVEMVESADSLNVANVASIVAHARFISDQL